MSMKKVITYGTYDLLHYGHIKLLERAKALGDYLVVGVTAEDFDKSRGKINVKQSLMERIEGVRAIGLADEIIVEEYEGQKIDDIRRYDIDIFAVGSDWKGRFDYLNKFCKVVYLERTKGVSSSEIRAEKRDLTMGMVGEVHYLKKFVTESSYVNGIHIKGICCNSSGDIRELFGELECITDDYNTMLTQVEAVYVISHPSMHYEHVKKALEAGKHVLCEAPAAMKKKEAEELFLLAEKKNCILMEALKTAYSTAYYRLLLLVKSGVIGESISVDATCTSLKEYGQYESVKSVQWGSLCDWGPTAMLPVFQVLGTEYKQKQIISKLSALGEGKLDLFTKINFLYPHAVASIKVGKGVKSEGELIISGTKGYIYVPAPWWKTDYFEVRYEEQEKNKRYFYQLDGEGIRYEIVTFLKSIELKKNISYIPQNVSYEIARVIEEYYSSEDIVKI